MNQKEKSAGKFQSTLPRGERQNEETPTPGNTSISIHAPTRGATLTMILMITIKLYIFQSTLPRGERPIPMTSTGYVRNFNPRSHEGSDIGIKEFNDNGDISIHAPTRGATTDVPSGAPIGYDFNPRSHEGSDSNFRQKVLFSLSKNCLKYLILTTNYFN